VGWKSTMTESESNEDNNLRLSSFELKTKVSDEWREKRNYTIEPKKCVKTIKIAKHFLEHNASKE